MFNLLCNSLLCFIISNFVLFFIGLKMIFKIRFSPLAQKDMDKVWDDVFEASKEIDVASKYVEDFIQVILGKKEYPESGIPLCYRGLFTGYYSVNFKAYKAFYRIKEEYIEILRIFMMKQDYIKILFENPDSDK